MREEIISKIAGFIKEIGIEISGAELESETVIPGIRIINGGLLFDKKELTYPGDLLHEAGHIAVKPAVERPGVTDNVGQDPAEEMMAILWSWAAAKHLNLDPKILFHDGGYKGDADSIIENFNRGAYFGLPMLQWIGLTADETNAENMGVKPFPHMIKWLRD